MIIPQDIRYRPYDAWTDEDKQELVTQKAQSPWLATYHIEPRTGLLNDPNGFSYFDGKYHLFYQNWPFGPAHGLKSWVHTVSDDLVHFEETGTVLYPDTPLDSHGAYSGSAYAIDDKLFLFYTGNVRDDNWIRTPLQIGAFMTTKGKIDKMGKVLIAPAPDCTDHFRDPQIFSYQGQLYAIIGAQNHHKQGLIKLYKAVDNHVDDWLFLGNLDFGNTGGEYMIECPNLVFIDNKPVLLYCPQGLNKEALAYDNIYPNTYKICQSFDTSRAKLEHPTPIQNLDHGFDCYATQAFNTPDGKALAVSWIGLPDVHYPTDQYRYQGAMSLVKELTLKNGKLYQYPVAALKSLRQAPSTQIARTTTANTYELDLTLAKGQRSQLTLFADDKGKGLTITLDTIDGYLLVDRSQTDFPFDMEHGQKRRCAIPKDNLQLNIFIDKSIFEIFLNHGETVLTGRYFPSTTQSGIIVSNENLSGYYYEMRSIHGRKTD